MTERNKPKKSKLLPPEWAIEFAWARTTQLSSNLEVRLDADRAKQQMDDIKKKAEQSKDDKESLYVNGVHLAIESTFRNLVTARNALDLNFTEALQLREQKRKNIQYAESFSSELQSLVPRISGMTIGGVSGGVLLSTILENWFPPSLKPYAMPLVLAFGAAIGYILHGVVVVPWVQKKLQKECIRLECDRIRYYKQYVDRVKASLITLYDKVYRLHREQFGGSYKKSDTRKITNQVLIGMEPSMCKYVSNHIEDIIKPEFWSMCETGYDAEKCKHYGNIY